MKPTLLFTLLLSTLLSIQGVPLRSLVRFKATPVETDDVYLIMYPIKPSLETNEDTVVDRGQNVQSKLKNNLDDTKRINRMLLSLPVTKLERSFDNGAEEESLNDANSPDDVKCLPVVLNNNEENEEEYMILPSINDSRLRFVPLTTKQIRANDRLRSANLRKMSLTKSPHEIISTNGLEFVPLVITKSPKVNNIDRYPTVRRATIDDARDSNRVIFIPKLKGKYEVNDVKRYPIPTTRVGDKLLNDVRYSAGVGFVPNKVKKSVNPIDFYTKIRESNQVNNKYPSPKFLQIGGEKSVVAEKLKTDHSDKEEVICGGNLTIAKY